MRHALSGKLSQLLFGYARPILEDDKGMRRFTPLFVRHPHHRDFLHGGMGQQNAFHFHGGDILATADDRLGLLS